MERPVAEPRPAQLPEPRADDARPAADAHILVALTMHLLFVFYWSGPVVDLRPAGRHAGALRPLLREIAMADAELARSASLGSPPGPGRGRRGRRLAAFDQALC